MAGDRHFGDRPFAARVRRGQEVCLESCQDSRQTRAGMVQCFGIASKMMLELDDDGDDDVDDADGGDGDGGFRRPFGSTRQM